MMMMRSRSPPRATSAAAESVAARRIQKAYRRFRKMFPHGGRVFSRSSPEIKVYQELPEFRAPLAERFAAVLRAAALLDPEQRPLVVARAWKEDGGSAMLRGEEARGYVRAGPPEAEGDPPVLFSGNAEINGWAVDGYWLALRQLGAADRWRLQDMQPWEIDYILVRFQRDEAAAVVAEQVGRPASQVMLLRTVVRPRAERSSSQRRRRPSGSGSGSGSGSESYEVPVAAGPGIRVIGAPGDPFRLQTDMRRFLAGALGGAHRYRWQINPLRRRRVAGKPFRRYLMRANHGLKLTSAGRILHAVHAAAGDVHPSRNWRALYPRPIAITSSSSSSSSPRRSPAAAGSAFRGMVARLLAETGIRPRSLGRRTSSLRSAGLPSTPGSASAVAGYIVDELHAGCFHAALDVADDGRIRVLMSIFDPHGKTTFSPAFLSGAQGHLDSALASLLPAHAQAAEASVIFAPVLAGAGLQYTYEGSCGPSSIALLFSLLRLMRARPAVGFKAAKARYDVFMGVRDEDVVVATQLVHSSKIG
jgi:hypothetical protein